MFGKLFSRFNQKSPKLFVIGLDCAPPEQLFDEFGDDLIPNLRRLMQRGSYREMYSSIPAITVPAWSSMTSSRDPGSMGFYGFRNRRDHSYDNRFIANGVAVKNKRVWELLDEVGKKSIIVGVPQTYPVKPLKHGHVVSSFLTPSTTNPRITWTHPAELRDEINGLLAPEAYDVDIPQFRTNDKEFFLKQLYDMSRKRYKVLRYLLDKKAWDFFMFVEMGTDRLNHAMWAYHDTSHRKHDPDSPYIDAIRDYYKYLDGEIGTLLERLPAETHVIVVSDHGAKKMDGGICINEWLVRKGYLVLKNDPPVGAISTLEKLEVDWAKTTVWGDGGYYARIFMNVEGREPEGAIPAADYETFRDKLIADLKSIPAPDGSPLDTRCFKPEETYQMVNGVAPDVLVYLDNLGWRSVGSFGHEGIYTFENDTGPDDANHAENGVWVYSPPADVDPLSGQKLANIQLMDFAPTVLDLMGVDIPADMQGSIIEK
ncbi:MAG: putative AlkP superfamily phosphohydrolase/phosphomutase [Cellvibrionaceae bacterium]|jgi:predicted AlkP superfamily phosphohydrolase/phosphomutase